MATSEESSSIDSRRRPPATRRFSAPQIAFLGGLALWLGTMFMSTGGGGVVALVTALTFLVELTVLSSATRTITVRLLVWSFLMGSFTMGLAYWAGKVVPRAQHAFLIPPMEEIFKLAPVLFLLWRWRKTATWALGATDVLLMAAVSGAGFGLVEDAYIRHTSGWPSQLSWLPLTEITGGRLIVGHAVWTALAGTTLGLALLMRDRGRRAFILGSAGFIWSILDHIANNYGVSARGSLAKFLNAITGDGWITLYLFVFGLLAVIVVDGYIVYTPSPRFPELNLGPEDSSGKAGEGLLSAWNLLLTKRALAFALFQYRKGSASARIQLRPLIDHLARALGRFAPANQEPLDQTQGRKPAS